MILRTLGLTLAALALPFAAIARDTPVRSPESQHPERQVNTVTAPRAESSPWPFGKSDLPVDPKYRFGVLANGLRYIIRPNDTPQGQGMVYLWVHTGSLGETRNQRGYAHFLEHMAFNGSKHVPEGDMVKLLERDGLAFGPDTNAQTSFDSTIYQLKLPRNDPKLLDTALMLMRETASNLTLAPAAVQREKGVIESELRMRDTFEQRNTINAIKFLYPGSLFARRWVSGSEKSVSQATAKEIRAYYERWYRPDNMAVIVVGDFDPATVQSEIRKHFGSWHAKPGPKPPGGGPIDYGLKGKTDIYTDPALPENVTVSRIGPYDRPPDSIESRQQHLLQQIGYGIINRRLQRLARTANPPFRGAALYTENLFKVARTSNLVVQAADGEWRQGLAAAEEAYRRAFAFGFTPAEVAEQVANIRSDLQIEAAGASTRSNASYMAASLALLTDGTIPTTPQSALKRFDAFAPKITPKAVLAALKKNFVPLADPLIRYTGAKPPKGGSAALRTAWDNGMTKRIAPLRQQKVGQFGYAHFGAPGKIVSDHVEPLLGIREIVFSNGLKLNLKKTDLARGQVQVQLNIDGGEMLDTRKDPLATAMVSSLLVGGLGKHTLDQLQTILAGKQVGVDISDAPRSFRFTGDTTPNDLGLQLRLFAALVSDPGFRPAGEAQYRRNVATFFAQKDATAQSALSLAQGRIISDGDPRFSLQSKKQYMALTFAKLRQAISNRLAHGAMELALVGDFNQQKAIRLVAQTLGALPQREDHFRAYTANRHRTFTKDRELHIVRHEGAANQAIIEMIWPTRDDSDPKQALQLTMLQRVMQLQLLADLREELGQTYSPYAVSDLSRVYPGWGTFRIVAGVNVKDVDAVRKAMLETIRKLRQKPVDADVMERARNPLLEAYTNALTSNAGWMRLVAHAQSRPKRIKRFIDGKDMLKAITAKQVEAMADEYLDPAKRLEIVALPKGVPASIAEPAAKARSSSASKPDTKQGSQPAPPPVRQLQPA